MFKKKLCNSQGFAKRVTWFLSGYHTVLPDEGHNYSFIIHLFLDLHMVSEVKINKNVKIEVFFPLTFRSRSSKWKWNFALFQKAVLLWKACNTGFWESTGKEQSFIFLFGSQKPVLPSKACNMGFWEPIEKEHISWVKKTCIVIDTVS